LDFQLSSFFGEAIPGRDDLAWFRRHNRPVLQQCLEQVLQAAYQLEDRLEREGVAVGVWVDPGNPNPDVRQRIAEEAEERISRAVELDCISSDW
jgi:hypothetical protein